MLVDSKKQRCEELVKSYVGYKLRKSGHNDWSSGSHGNTLVKHKRTLQILGDQFEQSYNVAFDSMVSAVNIHSANLKEDYMDILDKAFDDKINWGRVIGIFVLASKVSIKALDCERSDVVSNVISWTTEFFSKNRVGDWIESQGGWDNMVDFFSKGNPDHMADEGWKQACSFGLNMFSGAITLFSYLQKT